MHLTPRRRRRRPGRPCAITIWTALLVLATCTANGLAQSPPPILSMTLGVIVPERSGGSLSAATDRAVAQGLEMVTDEFGRNAAMLNIDFRVPSRNIATPDEAVAAADDLLQTEAINVLIGGWGGTEVAIALAEWAEREGIPFLNAGASSDLLRGAACTRTMFHIEPSDAMYLDAIAGWYVRSGFRRWFVVTSGDDDGTRRGDRLAWALRERHFGARIVERVEDPSVEEPARLARQIRRSNADVVVLLVPANDQLAWLAALQDEDLDVTIAAWPAPDSQSRTFMQASRAAAPTLGSGARVLAFEATLDRYGAREINARYLQRFGEPMDPPAWAAYQAVKIAYEGVFFGRSNDPEDIISTWMAPTAVFDLWKGIGTTFRPWDHQLRQSMYLVDIREDEPDPFRMGILVGELPAIYLPGTDPIERLDQIGNDASASACNL